MCNEASVEIKEPSECTQLELEKFCLIVCEGGQVMDGLERRVKQNGRLLALCYRDGKLAAVGALKSPNANYHSKVFQQAQVHQQPSDFPVELGWCCVSNDHRGKRLSGVIVERLLAVVDQSRKGAFATTDESNAKMLRTLQRHGFETVGAPYRSDMDGDTLRLLIRVASDAPSKSR